ncbi:MAG TPA: ornithine cyclodeaminase family protein, partial [Candidatus Aminicenantes bacterium]|nr:ornithine cyclodeaminase family protein [Candidatus Aminicenantes bacterium]
MFILAWLSGQWPAQEYSIHRPRVNSCVWEIRPMRGPCYRLGPADRPPSFPPGLENRPGRVRMPPEEAPMEPRPPVRYVTTAETRAALSMPEAIRAVSAALVEFSAGRTVIPARTCLEVPGLRTTALIMPAFLPGPKLLGLKLISLCEDNPARGLPLAQALTVVMDAERGTPLAVLEAGHLTAVRTGAASGAATAALARPDARVAAVFGAGVQGRTQLEAVAAVRPLRKAFIVDVDSRAAAAFAEEMGRALGLEIEPAVAAAAVRDANIVSTATTAPEPVFRDADLKP